MEFTGDYHDLVTHDIKLYPNREGNNTYCTSIDNNDELKKFATNLEKICIKTVENGKMTKDLALMVGPDQKWVNTNEFFQILKKELLSLN